MSWYDEDAELIDREQLFELTNSEVNVELEEVLSGPDEADVRILEDDDELVVFVEGGVGGTPILFPTTLRDIRRIVHDLRVDAREQASEE